MTSTYDEPQVGPFNKKLLEDLVVWAAQDHADITEKMFGGWGGWDQSHWAKRLTNGVCKSSYCMAGQAVAQSGYLLLYEDEGIDYIEHGDENVKVKVYGADTCVPAVPHPQGEKYKTGPYKGEVKLVRKRGVEPVYISSQARELLGLDEEEASAFFDGDNNIGRIIRLAREMCEARGLTLDVPAEVLALDKAASVSV